MANITLHSDRQTSATSVSNVFIDEYMTDANGEFVKIYLYLLRQLNAPDAAFSISAIADKFEHTEKDIRRALSYWERMHLLRLEYDSSENLTGVCFLDTASRGNLTADGSAAEEASLPEAPASTDNASDPAPDSISEAASKEYSAEEIAAFRRQEPVAELLFIAERYLGRILTPTDMNSILYWYDGLGFSADLIEYLIEYSVSRGHKSMRYIETVALAWADEGITTVTMAKEANSRYAKEYFTIFKSMGISGRNPVDTEISLMNTWLNDYGFTMDIIQEACSRTVLSTGQPSFQYADKILSGWKDKNVRTLADVRLLDAQHQRQRSEERR